MFIDKIYIYIYIPHACLMFEQMHFDYAYGAYFDFGNHTEKVCCVYIFSPLKWCYSSFDCIFIIITALFLMCHNNNCTWYIGSPLFYDCVNDARISPESIFPTVVDYILKCFCLWCPSFILCGEQVLRRWPFFFSYIFYK